MASCLAMKAGEVYSCPACGLTIRILETCSCDTTSLRTALSCCGGPFRRKESAGNAESRSHEAAHVRREERQDLR
jgi:hypothetical protein